MLSVGVWWVHCLSVVLSTLLCKRTLVRSRWKFRRESSGRRRKRSRRRRRRRRKGRRRRSRRRKRGTRSSGRRKTRRWGGGGGVREVRGREVRGGEVRGGGGGGGGGGSYVRQLEPINSMTKATCPVHPPTPLHWLIQYKIQYKTSFTPAKESKKIWCHLGAESQLYLRGSVVRKAKNLEEDVVSCIPYKLTLVIFYSFDIAASSSVKHNQMELK